MKKITPSGKIATLLTAFIFSTIIFSTASTSDLSDLEITDIVVTDVLCPSDASGAINITVSGGTSLYSFEWTDSNGSTYTTLTPDLKDLLPGVYTVTVSDASGSHPPVTSDPIEITATDTVAPVISVTDINLPVDPNTCEAAITTANLEGSVSVTENCSAGNPTGIRSDSLALSDPYPVGITTITWNVTDDNGNPAEPVNQVITITDNQSPVAVAKPDPISISLDASGFATITAQEIDNGSSDNCPDSLQLSLSQDTFDCSQLGMNTIQLIASDGVNPDDTVNVQVNVVDELPPAISAAPINQTTDTGECFATVAMNATATDNCENNPELTGVRSDGQDLSASYPVGTTTITWTASDGTNSSTFTQEVTVTDQEGPTIKLIPTPVTDNSPGNCYANITVYEPVVTDGCGVASLTSVRSDGKPLTDPFPVGTTLVTWTASDINNNLTETVQYVEVRDVEAPVIPTLPDIETSCAITLVPPTMVTDNCTPTAEMNITTQDPLTYQPQNNLSEHIITWRFEDKAGNVVTADQKLIINPLFSTTEFSTVTCNGGSDGSITMEASGGKSPYSYSINNGNFSDNATFAGLSTGTYSVKVKDGNGCILEEIVEITEPETLQYLPPAGDHTTTTAESCFGASDGEIFINGDFTGGNGDYVFLINGQSYNTNPIQGLPAGTYDIFVQDTNGCNLSSFLSATIEGPDMLDANVDITEISCYQGQSGAITISAPTGGNGNNYSFRINNGTWQNNSTPTGNQFTQLPKGTYTVEMKDNAGCSRILGTYILTEPDEIIPNVTTTRTTTYGSATGTATANPTGGTGNYTYLWQNATGTAVGNTKTVTGLKAGTYKVIVSDGNQCTGIQEFEVYDQLTTEVNAISLCLETDDTIRTSTFQVDLEKTMGGEGEAHRFTYIWDFGEGASLPSGTTGIGPHVVSYSSTGDKTVTLTVIDEGGNQFVHTSIHYVGECFEACTSANNFSGNRDSFYLGDINGNKMVTSQCDLSEPMYIWFIVGDKSANGYILNTEFIYTVTNRTSTKQFRATNCYSNPDYDQNGDPDLLVPGQKVRLNQVGTGENQIHWQCDEVLNIIHITYRWTVNPGKACGDTNNNHCASTNETMSVAAPIRGFAEATGTCHGQREGSIIIDAYGGTDDFTFLAVNNDTQEEFVSSINVFNNLPAGNYTVTITDNKEVADGQEANYYIIEDIVVSESDSGLSADVASTDISCFGDQNGTAKVFNVTGGTPFMANGVPYYKYLWNDSVGTTTPSISGLSPGQHTVTITDAFGCTLLKTVTINQPAELTPAEAGADQKRCGFTTTTLEANTPISGTGRWSISSQSTGASATITNVEDPNSSFTGTKGTYVLTWTISGPNNCYTEDSVIITIIEDCNYLDFDGIDDYVDMGDSYNFASGTYSLEAWVKLKTVSGTRTVLSKRNGSETGGYELVITSNGYPGFKIGSSIITPDQSIPLNTQRWYHLAITFDGTALKMYVDGLEVKNVTTLNQLSVKNPSPTAANFMIGATYDSSNSNFTKPGSHFKGWIEEVRLWKKALTEEQIRFMMNQRLESTTTVIGDVQVSNAVKGTELPLVVPPSSTYLVWSDLAGYYQLLSEEAAIGNGTTSDLSDTPVPGVLKNITTFQENSAPLPYESVRDGNWRDIETTTTPWMYGRGRWDAPNSLGINQQPINWNIVRTYDRISSGNKDITVLGLLSEKRPHEEAPQTDGRFVSTLSVLDPNYAPDEYNPGHGLRVTHYLRLNGAIDLVGESQLVQDEGSILEEASTGYIERDQQGTASSYNYNYWSSPVSPTGGPNNAPYTVKSVLRDGTDPLNPGPLNYNYQYHWADGNYSGGKRISTYWLYTYTNFKSNTYAEWHHVGESGAIKAGEGFSMKGTSGSAAITDRQNYTFIGKPNNGTIRHEVTEGNDYLVGNPYPSAIDSREFILDNIQSDGRRGENVFNGTLYFWDHFAGKTHYLQRYVGGYATLNLAGGIEAIATDERINATGESADKSLNPRRYIPVGQAFYVSTQLDPELSGLATVSGGDIIFKNSQRVFETEHQIDDESIFKSREEKEAEKQQEDQRSKIYLRYSSPEGFHRQILVTQDAITTNGFDLGYDAPLIENIDEDMYWLIHKVGFVIQAIPEFSNTTELPLTVKVHEEGEFTIAIDELENIPDDFQIHLKDTLEGTTHDLRKSPFKLTEVPGIMEGRFVLIFPNVEEPEEKPEVEESSLTSYYSSEESKVSIENPYLIPIQSATLYNLSGQKLKEYNNLPLEKLIELPVEKRASGVYIMKLQMENESKSIKFIVE